MLWFGNIIHAFFAIAVLVLLAGCSDYVGQIDEQIDEYKAHESARTESLVQVADIYVIPTSVFGGTFVDVRDSQVYRTVTIGTQTWMADNLNYDAVDSYCYNNESSNCTTYGRLYTWAAAMDSAGKWGDNAKGCGNEKVCAPTYPVRGVCPEGWHLPGMGEWITLKSAIGSTFSGGCGTSEKEGPCSLNTDDEYGLDIRLAGSRLESGKCYDMGKGAYFWSSTESNNLSADTYNWYRNLMDQNAGLKLEGMSVRCVKDVTDERPGKPPVETVPFTDERDGKTYETVTIGDQVWMAENLNYAGNGGIGHCYDDIPENCDVGGRLYKWNVAKDVCPEGWHLPSKTEFETMFSTVKLIYDKDMGSFADMFKATSGWKSENRRLTQGLDKVGFSAVPAGGRCT